MDRQAWFARNESFPATLLHFGETSHVRQKKPDNLCGLDFIARFSVGFAAGTVVYHINDAASTKTLLANLQNHVAADPAAKIYVVSNGTGINAFLKDAKDESGVAYESQLQSLSKQGVHFEVCNNSLKKRGLAADAVVGEASVVPAAVVEIARLQSEEKAAYIKP